MLSILQASNSLFSRVADFSAALATRRLLDQAAMVFGLMIVVTITAYGVVKPAYNWDMAAYIATALEPRIEDAGALHQKTWDVMRKGASPAQLHKLAEGNPYNAHQYETPRSFESQLSMFRVKVAYIAMIRELQALFGIAGAAIASSLIFTVCFGLLALYWLRQEHAIQAAFVVFPLFLIADYQHMTFAVLPDMMLGAVTLAALYLMARGRDWAAAAMLFFSVLVRPDNIILVFALLIASTVFAMRVIPLATTFAAGLAVSLYIADVSGHPGWWAHFWFSCIELQNSMTNFDPEFSVQALITGYVRGASVALRFDQWPFLFMILLAGWAALGRAGLARDRRANMMLFALSIGLVGKFVAFPLPDDRFYFNFIAGMAMILAVMWKPDFAFRR